MIVFRIGHPDYINDLSGTGAALQGGRWNSQGLKVIYTAETSSLAILELLAHIKGAEGLPYKLIQILLPDSQVKELSEITPLHQAFNVMVKKQQWYLYDYRLS